MALLADFVCETANSPGTATTISLVGAAGGSYNTFASRYTSGVSVYYTISDESSARETGIGTFTTGSPNTLARTTVLANTLGTTARLNFLGSVLVYNSVPASKSLFLDVAGNIVGLTTLGISGTLTAGSVISTGVIGLNNNIPLQSKDSGGTYRNILYLGSTNFTNIVSGNGSTGVQFLNFAQSTTLFSVSNAGVTTIAGATTIQSGGLSVSSGGFNVTSGISTLSGSTSSALSGWAYSSTGPSSFAGTFTYNLLCSNNIVASNFFANSDVRLKSSISEITSSEALDWLQMSRPVTYMKRSRYNSDDSIPEAGFIAQDQIRSGYERYVGTIPCDGIPERIDPDGLRSLAGHQMTLNTGNYVAYLTAALKTVIARIEVLEAKLQP